MTQKLIILRHGRSEWNQLNLFTGWVDVALDERGQQEAARAGELMREDRWLPDIVFTSNLSRSIDTARIALEHAGRPDIPTRKSAMLNERHYGALQGMDKTIASKQFGEEKVFEWRRSYLGRPPETLAENRVTEKDRSSPADGCTEPLSESMKDVHERVIAYWDTAIRPELDSGKVVLIAAHGNTLRALIKTLESVKEEDIAALEVPTGVPIVYELNETYGGKGRKLE